MRFAGFYDRVKAHCPSTSPAGRERIALENDHLVRLTVPEVNDQIQAVMRADVSGL
jgi:hypothetical protein